MLTSITRAAGRSGWRRALSAAAASSGGLDAQTQATLAGLKGHSLLRIDDYSPEQLTALLAYSHHLKRLHKSRSLPKTMDQESVAMIFQKRSTRTRVSTETGVTLLGGHTLFLSSDDVQLGVNETITDSARVLSRFNSLILARVFGHAVVEELVRESSVPVVNALSDMHHPLQILADFMTLQEQFGTELGGRSVAWVGDGNNVLHDIMLGAPLVGVDVRVATPGGYEPNTQIIEQTLELCEKHGTSLSLTHSPEEAVQGTDVVVTDTWVSMGEEEEAQKKIRDFAGYQVTHDMMRGASPGWRFLHCLPRHPEEVDDEVFYDEERSVVFDEAENRMYTVMAVASTMLGRVAV